MLMITFYTQSWRVESGNEARHRMEPGNEAMYRHLKYMVPCNICLVWSDEGLYIIHREVVVCGSLFSTRAYFYPQWIKVYSVSPKCLHVTRESY